MKLLDFILGLTVAQNIPHSRQNLKNADWETITIKEVLGKDGKVHVLRTYTTRVGRYRQ